LAALLLLFNGAFMFTFWVLFMQGFLAGRPAFTDPNTGIATPIWLLLALGPVAVAGLFAAWRASQLRSARLVLAVAIVTAAFALIALAAGLAKPILVWGHLGALALIWSGRSAIRS
jgi:hypothetical protein